MNGGASDLFGVPLQADPTKALKSLTLDIPKVSGPLHKVQFVIEFVGPRSMPAAVVSSLLTPEWYNALGQPEIFVMRPSDLQWTRLTPVKDGSYDSLALAWDFISPQGTISSAAALQLLQFAERFGPSISRRAMPLPHPAEVNDVVARLREAQEALDIGFQLNVLAPPSGFAERSLWIECARIGLDFGPEGSFDWRSPSHAYPLLSVTPIGEHESFSLGNVQAGAVHQGATVGFSVPLCPAPTQALEGCFYVATHLALALGGDVRDQDNRPLNDRLKAEFRQNLRQAISMYARIGITTGSPEAIRLFSMGS